MGTSKQSIVEVNGKRYDARTGHLIERQPQATPKKARLVNDFGRNSAASATVHKNQQRSQTLMRTGVKRPTPLPKADVKAAKPRTVSDFKPALPLAKRTLLPSRNENERQVRAATIKQSNLVRKFGDIMRPNSDPTVTPRVEKLAVQPAPLQHKPLALAKPKQKSDSLIENGLKNASAHKTLSGIKSSKAKRKRPRLVTYGASALAAVMLVGFIAYQNIPTVAVRYASTRAGVTASLPGYQPAGFDLSQKVHYNPGQITLNYSSNSDEREYTITQRDSNWNSETLKNNYVLGASTEVPQTYEDKGRTIYLYGESAATWVSNGIWYEIKGDSKLTPDQLIRIATSL